VDKRKTLKYQKKAKIAKSIWETDKWSLEPRGKSYFLSEEHGGFMLNFSSQEPSPPPSLSRYSMIFLASISQLVKVKDRRCGTADEVN
jgi:hypothetical protein